MAKYSVEEPRASYEVPSFVQPTLKLNAEMNEAEALATGLTTLEVCAGAGGQALGLEYAGFNHGALVEIDHDACRTLTLNRPRWNVLNEDMNLFDGRPYRGTELLAGGLPCPPFSRAGKQLGEDDERNLFPALIRLADEIRPQAIMIENVRGLLDSAFEDYRERINHEIESLGYQTHWKLLNAHDFGVSQNRARVLFVALRPRWNEKFAWPEPSGVRPPSVGQLLKDLMASDGWLDAIQWANEANGLAPTIVGGSKKHGGPDLGPTGARNAWAALGVNGKLVGNDPPGPGHVGMPLLTVRMVARIQGFPDDWMFYGRKTTAYRQVGNAFPPPLAKAVAERIRFALSNS
jgi:DNA (cytosine-5)-methyltransferase 1